MECPRKAPTFNFIIITEFLFQHIVVVGDSSTRTDRLDFVRRVRFPRPAFLSQYGI